MIGTCRSGVLGDALATRGFGMVDQGVEAELEGGAATGLGQPVELLGNHLKLSEKFVLERGVVAERRLLPAPGLNLCVARQNPLATRGRDGLHGGQAMRLQAQMMAIQRGEQCGFDLLGVLTGEGPLGRGRCGHDGVCISGWLLVVGLI